MEHKRFIKRLHRYLAGTSNSEEKKLIEEWYHSFPVHQEIDPLQNAGKEEQLFSAIRTKINQRNIQKQRLKTYQQSVLQAAAVLFLVCSVSFFWWKGHLKELNYKSQYVVISTGSKGLKKVTLPDSSTVWLNTSGKIRFQKTFTASNRVVYLDEGEAFFEVTKNAARPFYVYTPTLHTRVLGTSFNIKTYKSLDFVRITVASGKVQIANSLQNYGVYTAGQQLTYHLLDGKASRTYIENTQADSWRTGKIQLLQANFNELAQAFYSLYHIQLKTENPAMQNLKYTLTLESTQPVDDALLIINAIHETKTRRTSHDVTIYK